METQDRDGVILRVGDKVKRVFGVNHENLKIGDVFIITEIRDGGNVILNNKCRGNYSSTYFIKYNNKKGHLPIWW